MNINNLKKHAIKSLENAIMAHEKGDVFSIDNGFEEFDGLLPRESLAKDTILYITLEFWASWSDSAIHDWQFYPGIAKNDWPRLAKILISDFKADRKVTDIELLDKFNIKPTPNKVSLLNRVMEKIRGKKI